MNNFATITAGLQKTFSLQTTNIQKAFEGLGTSLLSFKRNTESVASQMKAMHSSAQRMVGNLGNAAKGFANSKLNQVQGMLMGLGSKLQGQVSNALGFLGGGANDAQNLFGTMLTQGQAILNNAFAKVQQGAASAFNLVGNIANGAKNLFGTMLTQGQGLLGNVFAKVQQGAAGAFNLVGNVANGAKNFLGSKLGQAGGVLEGARGLLSSGLGKAGSDAMGALQNLPFGKSISGLFNAQPQATPSIPQALITGAAGEPMQALNSVLKGRMLESPFSKAQGVMQESANAAESKGGAIQIENLQIGAPEDLEHFISILQQFTREVEDVSA